MGATEEKVARFIAETGDNEIPETALNWAKIGCFDCLGVMLAGAVSEPGKIISSFVGQLGGKPEASVVGTRVQTSSVLAALANGTLAHALDYDDSSGIWGHASCVLFPPLISLGERSIISGRALLGAYVIGYRVAQAIRSGCYHYSDEEQGFHKTSVFGVMAATAACARLLRLNTGQTLMALGTASSMAGGLDQNLGTYTKPLHAGLASQNGIIASLLAKDGWTGTDRFLESRLGFLSCYVGTSGFSLQAIRDSLESRPLSVQLKIKEYPCCGANDAAVDALLSVLKENDIFFNEIERVTVENVPYDLPVMLYSVPSSGFQGKFSLRYNLATAMIDGRIDIGSYGAEKLERPQFREALAKLDLRVVLPWEASYDPRAPENPVAVLLKDGRVFRGVTNKHAMRGAPANPLSTEEINTKFLANARLSLPPAQAERACDLWWNMEQMENIADGLGAVRLAS